MPEITKQDALRWLEMQRDAINTEIAYAAPSDKNQYFGNLKVVNWLTERVKEMSAVEYLEAHWRMCKSADVECMICPMCHTVRVWYRCVDIEEDNPRRAIEIVKKWKEEQDGH